MSSRSHKYDAWINAGFYSALQKISVVFFGVVSTMLLAHKGLQVTQMGVWSLFLVMTGLVEMIRHGLIRNSFIKYLSGNENESNDLILASALIMNIAITILISFLLIILNSFISHKLHAPDLIPMINIFVVCFFLLVPFLHFEWIMIAESNFKGIFFSYLMRQGVTLLLLVIWMLFKLNVTLNLLVFFLLIGIITGSITAATFCKKYFKSPFVFSKEWIIRLWQFGKNSFGTGISNLIFRNSDQFLVSNLITPAAASLKAVALQGISLRIFNMCDIPSQVIGDILFPKSANLSVDDHSTIRYYYEKSVGITLAIILPIVIGIVIFSKWIILILAGVNYLHAIPYLRVLMIITIFLAFLKQFGTITDGTGLPHINFYMLTVIAAVNIFSCYYFISHYGLMGAAYGLIITHLIAFGLTQYILYKLYGIRFYNCIVLAFKFYPEILHILKVKLLNYGNK